MEEFKGFGEITDMWIAYDPPGFAFLEFSTAEAAAEALRAKHKTECFGSEIRVEFTKKKDDLKKEQDNKDSGKPRLFIGSIVNAVEKEDVRGVFEKFGNVTDVWIAHNPPGFAFVEFDSEKAANKAVEETNGSELFGGNVRVQITKGRREGRRNRVNEMRDKRAGPRGGYSGYHSAPPARQSPYPPPDPYGRRRPPARDPYAREPYARDPYYASPYARDPYYAREAPAPAPASAPAPAPAPYYPPDPYARDPYYARDYGVPPPRPRRPEPAPRAAYPAHPAHDPYGAPYY